MGCWSETILGNDIAMDTVCILEDKYKELGDFGKALKECKSGNPSKNYNEAKLFIAYAQLFNNSITNKESIIKVIDEELSEDVLENWNDESRLPREKTLINFKNQIINYKKSNVKHTDQEIKEWLKSVGANDILGTI